MKKKIEKVCTICGKVFEPINHEFVCLDCIRNCNLRGDDFFIPVPLKVVTKREVIADFIANFLVANGEYPSPQLISNICVCSCDYANQIKREQFK